jgi:predicted metal-dependent HD superfamily phosphohydrolase
MDLEKIYTELFQKIGFSTTEIRMHWKDFEKVYSKKSRHYHNLIHLEEMIVLYEIYHSKLQFPDEVLYAIFYHDYVYKVTKKDNEQKSAEYALSILPSNASLNKQLVFEMICATQLHQHNETEDINWLIDFDLKILSKDWKSYQIYCEQIRSEYKIYPDFLYKLGRKKALQHFLENDFIYQTPEFRTKYEQTARQNIQLEIQVLSNSASQ